MSENSKNGSYNFLALKRTSSHVQKILDIQFTFMYDTETLQILTIELEPANFCFKKID